MRMKPAEMIPVLEIVRRSLDEGQQPFFQVTSNSMSPLIRTGDDVQIAHQEVDQLTIGDILVIVDESGLLTHRLWQIISISGNRHVLLRGDRLNTYDPPYLVDQVIGRVIARRRDNHVLDLTAGLGRVLSFWLFKFASLTNPPIPYSPDIQALVRIPVSSDRVSTSPFHRFRNRFLLVAATALTSLIDLMNRHLPHLQNPISTGNK